MKISTKKLRSRIRKVILESELHVFDFDETLGTTPATTNVVAVRYLGGDPQDFENSYEPVTNISGMHDNVALEPEYHRFLSGGKFLDPKEKGVYYPIAGAEMIALDTDQYKIWKNDIAGRSKYVNAGDGVYDGIAMEADGTEPGTLIYVRDFSPSFKLGKVKPIKSTVDIAKSKKATGERIGVVTARAGESELPSITGTKFKAQNKDDIYDFGKEQGLDFDFVHGAADTDPRDPSNAKRDLIGMEFSISNADELHFYDDDPQNIRKVQQLCKRPALDGKDITTYQADFHKGQVPSVTHCTVNELRQVIRKALLNSRRVK